ncbi:MAG: hypothetical protein U9P12_05095, partial [Verrucomicrobiota bacterium]|nr:hypothetical protein [Verrucomicrobiota bacterium]
MRSWTVYLRTIVCMAACFILAVDEVRAVTITLTPTGTPGWVYGDSDFTNDIAYDSTWFSGVAGVLNNQDTGATDPFVVAADGSGITQPASTVNWWENGNVWDDGNQAPRTAFYFDIQEAAAGKAFTLDSVAVTVGGVAGNGIRMRLIYRTGGSVADLHIIDFNGGANVSDGTYSIDLSAAGLDWTDHSTPLLDGDWFRIGFYDPSTGNDTSGTAVIENVEIKACASPLLEIEAGTDQVVLHLRGDNGMAYAVRRTPDLMEGSWSNIAFGNLSADWLGITNSTEGIPQAFYQAAALVNTHYLGEFDGFYRNRRVLDVKLDNAAHKIIVPDWLCDTNTLDFPYGRKDNPLVASDGKEMFLADNLVLVRVLGGWVTNSANPTIADVKQNDLFYLDGNDQAAYRWNLLDKRVDPLI